MGADFQPGGPKSAGTARVNHARIDDHGTAAVGFRGWGWSISRRPTGNRSPRPGLPTRRASTRSGSPSTISCPTFSVAPGSDQFLAAVAAQQTSNIRVGTGVVVLPYHHPIHVAERIAMLDLISEGRVEFGTGRGGLYEVTGHSIDPRDTRALWEESLACIEGIWSSYPDEFSWEGEHWQIPPRVVVPQPVQKSIRRWLACAQPASFSVAADHGMGVLAFVPSPPSVTAPLIEQYRERIASYPGPAERRNENWASMTFGVCDEDGPAARELVSRSLKVFFGPDRPYNAAAAAITKSLFEAWDGEIPEHLKVHMTKEHETAPINAAEVATAPGSRRQRAPQGRTANWTPGRSWTPKRWPTPASPLPARRSSASTR